MASVRPLRSTPLALPCWTRSSQALAHHPLSMTISSFTPYQQGHSILQLQVSVNSAVRFQAMMFAPSLRLPPCGSLLLPSAFHRKFNALAAGAVEFKVLSSRLVKAVAGLAQCRPLKCFRSLVLNHHRILRVCATANRRNLHLSNFAHRAAGCLPDLAEGVQVLQFDRCLLQLGRVAPPRT